MARLETKSIKASPGNRDSVIRQYETFGWTCTNVQEIYSQDSHMERSGNNLQSVTETTNYFSLTFQRDRDMDHYNEVVQLENTFIHLQNNIPVKSGKGKGLVTLGVIALIIGLLLFIPVVEGPIGVLILALPFLAAGVVALVFGIKKKKKATKDYDTAFAMHRETMNAVLEQVRAYC